MPWRVLANGAMIEVVMGNRPDGSEYTTTQIVHQGQVIKGELSSGMIERYDGNEAYVRSIVERVSITEDEDGEPVVTPAGKPEPDESDSMSSKDLIERNAKLEGDWVEAEKEVSSLKDERDGLQATIVDLQAKVDDLTKENDEYDKALEEATAPKPFDYSLLSPEAVQAEVTKRGLTVTGTGSKGNVLKDDNVKALQEADAATS